MNILNHIPMNNNEPTAILEDWYIIGLTIYGRCYGDRKHRFHPGVLVGRNPFYNQVSSNCV